MRMSFRPLCIIAMSLFPAVMSAAPVSGEAVFKQRCASCHDSGNLRAPSRDDLKQYSVTRIQRALDFGLMSNVAGPLKRDERDAVAAYLGSATTGDAVPAKAYCVDRSVKLGSSNDPQWNGWS